MRSAITISLVPEAIGGPFVFWNGLEDGCARAAELGFNAVEIFPPNAGAIRGANMSGLLENHDLRVAAIGTGAGWVKHKLSLTSPDAAIRERARDFIGALIDAAADFGAPAIVGSLQGRAEPGVSRSQQIDWLRDSIAQLAIRAESRGQFVLLEPLNRYETNLLNSVAQGLEFLGALASKNVRLLLDVFHMNIEEADIAASIRAAGPAIGHVHFADSNRRAVGWGHIDYAPIISALRESQYEGYLSAEILPLPDSRAAAAQSIKAFRGLTGSAA